MSLQDELLDTNIQDKTTFKELNFPINFEFKIGTLANDFTATDAQGSVIAYVRQKMFKFKEAITVYSSQAKTNELYKINADRVIDFNANYAFTNVDGETLGKVGRKGMKSLWKANYQILNNENGLDFEIKEENPWAKVMDALCCEIPVVGMFTGYMFNPKYLVSTVDGSPIARLSKEASFWGRRFKLEKLGEFDANKSESIMLSLMMMVLLERRRG
jgi:uncharacterized protein YxjI